MNMTEVFSEQVIALDKVRELRKKQKDQHLSTMNSIYRDIVNYMEPRGHTAMEIGEAYVRAERVIQGGGKVADALYQAFKPLWDNDPPRAA